MKTGVGVLLVTLDLECLWLNERQHCKDYNGCWQVPGGTMEEGEEPRLAAARELLEETGIVINPDKLQLLFDEYLTKPSGEHYHSIQFLCVTDERPENRELDKHGMWTRCTWEAASTMPTFGALKKILSQTFYHQKLHRLCNDWRAGVNTCATPQPQPTNPKIYRASY